MARKASTKPESGASSTATIGFEAVTSGQPSEARQIAKGNPQGESGRVYQFGVPTKGNVNYSHPRELAWK